MGNKLSNSAVDKYIECSLCYKLHYIDRIRPVRGKSALLFGAALDVGLNELLLTKDLEKAQTAFFDKWFEVDHYTTDFSKSDLDQELIMHYKDEIKIPTNGSWYSLYIKGRLFIEQYHKDILPKIKKVIAVQEPVSLKNADGDEITGILDLVVQWEDGKIYLLDNKSSSVKYASDSAKTGQQLPLYYYIKKDDYKLDGVGYIVMSKKINKNKVKTCKKCHNINEGRHDTCPILRSGQDMRGNTTIKQIKCGGEFDIKINPSVDIEVILNSIDEADERRVIETFDHVNNCVVNGVFAEVHPETKNKYFQYCPYKEYYENHPSFIKLPKK